MSLHCLILSFVGETPIGTIGVGDGASCIFPYTLQNPRFSDPPSLLYRLVEGEFHDGRNYYRRLFYHPDPRPPSRFCSQYLGRPFSELIASDLATYSNFVISARPTNDALEIRTAIRLNGVEIQLDFLVLHLNYMSMNIARACSHNPTAPLDKKKNRLVVPTSAATPIATGNLISITLTHNNPEAQFVACDTGAALFQGNACLNCAVDEAVKEKWKLVIQA
jgi:hypothetical protein